MVWPGLVPVRPAKACALFPPFEAEVLLLRRERERERERVPTSPTTGRWTAHTLRPVTLQAWPVKHRNHLPTLESTDQRSKEHDTLCKWQYYVSIHIPVLVILFLILLGKPFPLLTSGNDVKKSTFQTGKSGQVSWCKSVDTRVIAKFKYCPNSMWRRFRPIETHWK